MDYYIPRGQEDTAKAIYRLVSIGVVDSYTIDYQNKLYNIEFVKKSDSEYYYLLEELISRYTSKNVANREIEDFKISAQQQIESGKATVISKCLEKLTDFIYSKIKQKRLQAIDDMVKLCQTAIAEQDPLKQNHLVKDEIYYYFNAKYSRPEFFEDVISEPASMLNDLADGLEIREFIWKYIRLVQNNQTGELLTNVKHLRGSAMRMLRSNPDEPQLRILKSFSLFVLADTIKELMNEAKQELVKGLIDWKCLDRDLNVQLFIDEFRLNLNVHILKYDLDETFNDIEDHYYSKYYAQWANKFSKDFLD
jgi:ATP-dependent DNA helicase RecQ